MLGLALTGLKRIASKNKRLKMTINELATTPEIVLGLLSLMLTVLIAIAGIIWKICKAVVPVFISLRTDVEKQRAVCGGKFDILELRFDEQDEKLDELGHRVGVIEIDLKAKKEHVDAM